MRTMSRIWTAVAVVALVVACGRAAEDKEEMVPLDKLPKAITDAVKKRFPKAEMVEAAKETVTDGGKETVSYEVSIKDGTTKIDLMLTPEGVITLIEKAISEKDLPKAVSDTLAEKYPKATFTLVEELIKVTDGKEALDVYEVLLVTADKKTFEVKLTAAGKITESMEKVEEKKEEKKPGDEAGGWTDDFAAEKPDLTHTGRNPLFVLEAGHQTTFEDGKDRLVITVLTETKTVDGVECRVVEERETKDGQVIEVSRNYFAISKRTNGVYYFGEDVDMYKDGKVTSHDGSWLAGKDGAKFGLMMPGLPLVGARYHQEVAPKVAMDRAEVVSVTETVKTPAGEFKKCVKTAETTPLEKGVLEYKLYAPGVGLVQDGDLKLTKVGKVESTKK